MSDSSLSRRRFLEQSATLGLSVLGLVGCRASTETTPEAPSTSPQAAPAAPAPAANTTQSPPAGRAKVVLVKNMAAVKSNNQIDEAVVAQMLEKGLLALTGAASASAAWQTFLKPEDVVGLKINCLLGLGASTSPAVTMAVAKSIQQIGIPAEKIIIWDRIDGDLRKSGYAINRDGVGVKCFGTGSDYEPQATSQGEFNGRLSKILTQQITALVNVPILKDHMIAGITVSMKNHYGSFDNPFVHHDNNCDPYIADVNSLPVIREKTRLLICDALRPIPQGGPMFNPQYAWTYGGLLLGTDPVALDYWGWRIIEARRKEIGLRTLEQERRPPRQLASAAALGLGTNDPQKIDLVEV